MTLNFFPSGAVWSADSHQLSSENAQSALSHRRKAKGKGRLTQARTRYSPPPSQTRA